MRAIKLGLTAALPVLATSSFAVALTFDSPSFAANGATQASWLAATGEAAPDFLVDFESTPVGNVSGVSGLFPGLVITSVNGIANVTTSAGNMGGSNPIGTKALALQESSNVTLAFDQGLDYFAFYRMDLNVSSILVNYEGGTSESFSMGGTGSSGDTALFWGIARNDRPLITSLVFNAAGGDGEYGLDNIQYGQAVPEPATMAILGLAVLGAARRRSKGKS